VAVLPFVNVNNDPNTEYLSDGISDSIINSLSRSPTLKVMSLNSVLRYKGKQTDPQQVGREQNVRVVLMGRLTEQGDSLVISTELVDVRDNRRLWGEQYNRKLSDIIVVQTDIAREISENLRLRLSSQDKKQLAKRYTENSEAYQGYLLGQYHLRKLSKEGFEKALEYFEQAINKDPAYAPAYVGVAVTYGHLGLRGLMPPNEAQQKAEAATRKALQLDDTLAEAHTSLGYIKKRDWDWPAAEKEFKRALAGC
jgi:TolB-like protein